MQFKQSSPARAGGDDHLIPLINIVFLMLIFFMIAGQIVPTDSLTVTPPTSIAEQPAPAEDISLLMNLQGEVALNGEPVTLENLAERLKDLLPSTASENAPHIALKVDAALPARELDKILQALREAQATKVTLFTLRDDV